MSTVTLAALNGNASKPADWLQWTVKEFFTHVN